MLVVLKKMSLQVILQLMNGVRGFTDGANTMPLAYSTNYSYFQFTQNV